MSSNNYKFNFPAIFSINEKFGKNMVQQLYEPFATKDVTLSSLQVGNKKYVVLKDTDENKYLLTNRRKGLNTTDYNKVLFGKYDDILDIQSNVSIKYEWIKHPKLVGLTDSLIKEKAKEAFESWKNVFDFKLEDIDNNIKGLRNPQYGAIHSILGYWTRSNNLATVVMPTGTGKTEVMLGILANGCCQKLLIVVPTDPLREQMFNKFLTFGQLKEIGALKDTAVLPVVGVLNTSFVDVNSAKLFFEKCNVVITTMSLARNFSIDVQNLIIEVFSHLFIDEAHHSEAKSWHDFRNSFKNSVLQFTATPFREDGKRIDGDIIYSYPLRKAQEEGYFKKINYVSVLEWDQEKADKLIADTAVNQLKLDIENGFSDHMLMARVSSRDRANEIYEIYKQYSDFNPVIIHTGIPKQRREDTRRSIINRKTKIIVCVDMLGEGFDLPELKIAAFHDVKKSLPITLQLAGRFTRSKIESKIGDATFIANRADDVNEKLSDLYSYDSDWNYLLQQKSENLIKEEIDYKNFLSKFTGFKNMNVSLQNLFPAMSTVIFKNNSNDCNLKNYREGLIGIKDDDFVKHVKTDDEKTYVIITGQKIAIEWGQVKDIYDTIWNLYIIHYDENQKLLFIHCSDTGSLYHDLAKAIIGDSAQIVNGLNVFRALSGINRLKLQNVGLKEIIGRLIRYTSRNGTDIAEALTDAEKRRATKAVIFGVGFEGGAKSSMGCSYKGRIWSKQKSNLKSLISWFTEVGKKVLDETIDPNEILKNTFTPIAIKDRPEYMPIGVDWNEFVFERPESRFTFEIDGTEIPLYLLDLELTNPGEFGNITFALKSESKFAELELILFEDENGAKNFNVNKKDTNQSIFVSYGRNKINIEKFFNEHPPTIWFVNGSSLSGNSYVDIQNLFPAFDKNNIITRDWTGVNLRNESQGFEPKIIDSIQYSLIQELKGQDYDIIYDDDNPGEVSDIVTVKEKEDYFEVELYHLKFAKGGRVGTDIDNLYQVCGQAQKSIDWKFAKDEHELFEHLLRRNPRLRGTNEYSRIEKGNIRMIEKFKAMAKDRFTIKWKIFIVQPAISKSNMTNAQLDLLGVTESYLRQQAEIPLYVIGSN
jgi:superfamily II DNA or RNA helicase